MKSTEVKIKQAVRLLQAYGKFLKNRGLDETLEIAYSGGKDSDVLLFLAKEANIKFRALYKNTTIDPPCTIQHVKEAGVFIQNPKETFLSLMKKKGWPTMFKRWCCSELKEYYTSPYLATGVRCSESVARTKRYTSPSSCRSYSGNRNVEIIHPMYQFSDLDIYNIITERHIPVHPLYYDEYGKFHVERRLGCIGCPLQGDRGKRDYKQYPLLLRAKCKAFLKWCESHNFDKDPYEFIMYQILYSNNNKKNYENTWHGLFCPESPKEFLEDYFQVTLP